MRYKLDGARLKVVADFLNTAGAHHMAPTHNLRSLILQTPLLSKFFACGLDAAGEMAARRCINRRAAIFSALRFASTLPAIDRWRCVRTAIQQVQVRDSRA